MCVKGLSSALYGMRGMNSDRAAVRAVVAALTPKLEACSAPFDPQAVGNSLFGLQGMNSDSAEVRRLLLVLSRNVTSCVEPLSLSYLSNALYGLQGMTSESSEVCSLLTVLKHKIKISGGSFAPHEVGNALYGLQGMSSKSTEVHGLLSALVPHVDSCDQAMDVRAVGSALYGLQGTTGDTPSSSLLNRLLTHLEGTEISTAGFHDLSDHDLESISRHLALLLPLFLTRHSPSWLRIHDVLDAERLCRQVDGRLQPFVKSPTAHEQRVFECAREASKNSDSRVSMNEMLFGIFESDVVMRVPLQQEAADGECLLVNIEVDGLHHRWGKKKRFCNLRDHLLHSKGVTVERLDDRELLTMTAQDLESWIRDAVARAVQSHSKGAAEHQTDTELITA